MKHRIKGRRLSRNSAHRKALFRNLAISLITHSRIKTTLPKAKELRPFIEKILTISKVDNLANRRLTYSILGNNHEAVNTLFTNIGPKIANRNGGYTRILKCGFRTGDKAPMSLIEFVDDVAVKVDNVKPTQLKKDTKKTLINKDSQESKVGNNKEKKTAEVTAPEKESKAKKSTS